MSPRLGIATGRSADLTIEANVTNQEAQVPQESRDGGIVLAREKTCRRYAAKGFVLRFL